MHPLDIGVVLIQCSGDDPHSNSHSLSDPTTLKTPSGDYKTQNFSEKDLILMNMVLMLFRLIAIFLFDSTLGKAFDSQRNNKDIFQKDSRGKQGAKEMLRSNQAYFFTNPQKSEQKTVRPSSTSLSQSKMTTLLLL
jgi:hypothetical protein